MVREYAFRAAMWMIRYQNLSELYVDSGYTSGRAADDVELCTVYS